MRQSVASVANRKSPRCFVPVRERRATAPFHAGGWVRGGRFRAGVGGRGAAGGRTSVMGSSMRFAHFC